MGDPAVDACVTLRGLSFHYRAYAPPAAGAEPPALVLLHGVASNAKIWITTAPLLARRYHVFALDQRGHGESDKPDGGYDFASVAGDLRAFVDALELERPVIVGHSWGGNVALEYAVAHPDGLSGLVLVDGWFHDLQGRPGMTWERAERDLAPPELTHLTPQRLIEGAKQWELGPIWSAEVEEALLGNFDVTEEGTIRPRLRREHHMQVVRAMWEQRVSDLFQRVQCPVLYVLAERTGRAVEWTAMKQEAVTRAMASMPDCRVRWFADTIHDIPLHRPSELAEAIREFADSLSG